MNGKKRAITQKLRTSVWMMETNPPLRVTNTTMATKRRLKPSNDIEGKMRAKRRVRDLTYTALNPAIAVRRAMLATLPTPLPYL